jgi:GNAT superfamily N-acetyltransferase
MDLTISVLADRPDLEEALEDWESPWPEFMRHDPIGNMYYALSDLFAEYVLVAQDDTKRVVAQAFSVPFRLDDDELPVDGWDGAIRRGLRTRLAGDAPNMVSAIEISVREELQGAGLSPRMLAAMRANAARLGFSELVAPVRPNGKKDLDLPMAEYAFRTREDGLPVDPWLRVHVRAGGQIDKVATRSMVIPGTLAEWREWTGLPFDRSGPVHVPFALAPVMCDVEHDHAVYVEPNVWVRHKIARTG